MGGSELWGECLDFWEGEIEVGDLKEVGWGEWFGVWKGEVVG